MRILQLRFDSSRGHQNNFKYMGLILLASLIALITSLLVGGVVLTWIIKLFKLEKRSYIKSLIVLIFSGIASIISNVIFGIINLGFLSNILAIIVIFFVFHYLLKKYYQTSWKKSLGIYAVFGIISLILSSLIIVPFRHYVAEPFTINNAAMSPAYNNGDYLLINKFDKTFVRGDVVVFKYKEQPKTFFVKRIIGLPSEKIEIKNGGVYINDQVLSENYCNEETKGEASITLGQDQYFVLGDDRNISLDSRVFGPVAKSDIQGKIFYKVSGLLE